MRRRRLRPLPRRARPAHRHLSQNRLQRTLLKREVYRYNIEALRKSVTGTYIVNYSIQPDGSTQVGDIKLADGPNQSAKWLRPAIARWAESLRYEPEQVNGQAVVTTMSFPVEFKINTSTKRESTEAWRTRDKAELEARAMASTECLLASGGPPGLTPIALDSPVKVTPTPAG